MLDNQSTLAMENRTVKEASVEGVQRRTHPKKHFMFCIKVSWSDGTVNLIYRRYSEFLDLQRILFQAFPGSLGRPGTKRKFITPLPDSLTTRMNVGETIFRRMEQVNHFLKEILSLEHKVSQSKHSKTFLTPTQEDLEPLPVPKKVRFKKRNGRRRSSNFTQTVKRLKFGKTRVFGNKISSPIVLEHFVVMDDYKKQAKSDINLKKGRTVDVIEKRECGWWLVECDGEVGWAPALYLEPADEMADASNVQKFPVGRGEIYVTCKRYVAAEGDELSFEIGVNLQILEKNYDGWWKASYLGKEGLVPSMYLKKLGNDRRKSLGGRRKSRLFSSNELRGESDDEDEVPPEIPEEEKAENNKDRKTSVPRKISQQVMSAIGRKTSKEAETIHENPQDAVDGGSDSISKGDRKTIDTMVEMSTVFLQLQKKDSNPKPGQGIPEKSQTLPRSPRPSLQHKAMSTLVASSLGRGLSADGFKEGSKDDMSLGIPRSRSMDSVPTSPLKQNVNKQLDSKWKPESKNVLSSSLKCVNEIPEPDQDKGQNDKTDSGHRLANALNDLSLTKSNSISENEKDSVSLKNEGDNDLNDIDSCDIRSESTSSTGLTQSPEVCEQPIDLSRYFQTISLNGESPRLHSPKRVPPVPSLIPPSLHSDPPRSPAPSRIAPVPSGISTFPKRADAVFKPQDTHRNPQSIDRKIIRQASFEKETAVELNEEIQYWSSSEESEPELLQLSVNGIGSPTIVVDNAVESSTEEEDEEEEEEDEEEVEEMDKRPNGTQDISLQSSINSNESLKIQIEERSIEDENSNDIYCVFEACEVDSEMHLTKGDYVQVLERASTGWWLVKNEAGLKGWAPSNFLCPAPQVHGNTECPVLPKEGESVIDKECKPQMSCRVIEDYKGDPYNQEIDLRRGEFAHILHKSESGWWCIQDEDGEVGWAPSNYLEVFEDEDAHEYVNHVGH